MKRGVEARFRVREVLRQGLGEGRVLRQGLGEGRC